MANRITGGIVDTRPAIWKREATRFVDLLPPQAKPRECVRGSLRFAKARADPKEGDADRRTDGHDDQPEAEIQLIEDDQRQKRQHGDLNQQADGLSHEGRLDDVHWGTVKRALYSVVAKG